MGSIFGFICDDVKEKIELLYNLLNDTENSNFTTVKKMIEHEKNNHLLNKKDYVSGSRTLLRLHRGLGTLILYCKIIFPILNVYFRFYSSIFKEVK